MGVGGGRCRCNGDRDWDRDPSPPVTIDTPPASRLLTSITPMGLPLDAFVSKWSASSAAERANKDAFLLELCDVLDVPRPDASTGDPERDQYVFEKDARMPDEGGAVTVGKIDLYKQGCFVLEAKQGSDPTSKKLGTAKRGTPHWNVAMQGVAPSTAHAPDGRSPARRSTTQFRRTIRKRTPIMTPRLASCAGRGHQKGK